VIQDKTLQFGRDTGQYQPVVEQLIIFWTKRDTTFSCHILKVEEKRKEKSLRKLRKPGEREREKYFATFFEISHTKREKTFL
jgi:hypothetical protein